MSIRLRPPLTVELPANEVGLTMIELLIALSLAGLLLSTTVGLLVSVLRSHRTQTQRSAMQSELRTAVASLAGDLRELNTGDTASSDLIEIGSSSLTYKATRGVSWVCAPPDLSRLEVTVSFSLGLRMPEAGRDSILIYALPREAQASGEWLRGAIRTMAVGAVCPRGEDGARVRLAGISRDELARTSRGAPVRALQVTQVRSYQDSRGTTWLGLREWRYDRGWSATQPFAGPLVRDGIRLRYYDAAGSETADAASVALIQVGVIAGNDTVSGSPSDTLVIDIAVRNRPSPPVH